MEFPIIQPITPAVDTPGDFVVGFSTDSNADLKPVALDTSGSPAGRSYASVNGGATFLPVATALREQGNFLIRAVVTLGTP